MFLRWMLGNLVSKVIMPSQHDYPKRTVDSNELNVVKNVGNVLGVDILSVDRIIDSSGDAKIFFSEYQSVSKYSGSYYIDCKQKIIINAVGNGDYIGLAEDFFINMAYAYPSCRVVGFDCRNVDRSRGTVKSEQDWIDDAIAVIDYYHNEHGIPYDNMILHGHSLGSAILTMAAAQIYQRELRKLNLSIEDADYKAPCVNVINSRSFADISSVIAEYINLGGFTAGLIMGLFSSGVSLAVSMLLGLAFIHSLIFAGLVLAICLISGFVFHDLAKSLVKYMCSVLLYLVFGDMDAASAYKILPEERRDYLFVKQDEVIRGGGLHHAMKAYYKTYKSALACKIRELELDDTVESKSEADKLRTELIRIWQRKLFTEADLQEHRIDPEKSVNRHTVKLSELRTWSKKVKNTVHEISGAQRLSNQLDLFLDDIEIRSIASLNI